MSTKTKPQMEQFTYRGHVVDIESLDGSFVYCIDNHYSDGSYYSSIERASEAAREEVQDGPCRPRLKCAPLRGHYVLYHQSEHALEILESGFEDGVIVIDGKYIGTGTYLTHRALTADETSESGPILELTFPFLAEIEPYELERGAPYRCWCVPAGVLRSEVTEVRSLDSRS